MVMVLALGNVWCKNMKWNMVVISAKYGKLESTYSPFCTLQRKQGFLPLHGNRHCSCLATICYERTVTAVNIIIYSTLYLQIYTYVM